ncbi:hypothetical protein GQ44DRAFT_704854 [Phaeosphaeriaceae sp. PMI808]|nr:hypothetical protein GQ44DRAFT_704854 [Phaeosphaeriaceae sp. PMI808]
MIETFDPEEDSYRRSPGLEPVYPKAIPSPSPPPVVTKVFLPPNRPTQGDWVLIREMAPNQPEIAYQVSQQALNSDSDSNPDSEDDMEDQSSGSTGAPLRVSATYPVRSGAQPFYLQQPDKDASITSGQTVARSTHRDSVVEADIRVGSSFAPDRRASEVSAFGSQLNGSRLDTHDAKSAKPSVIFAIQSTSSANQSSDSASLTHAHDELSANLHQLQIPQSDKLPMIQPVSPLNDTGSPNSQAPLPPISLMVGDITRSTSISEETRTNGLVHRQSISSMGQSPTSRVRQVSISSHTPTSPYALASSPISANSDLPKRDIFLQSGHFFRSDTRRPSQVSESGRYAPTVHSASNSEGYQSSDGPSPGAQQAPIETRPRHLSLDGAIASAIILPPPIGSNIQPLGAHAPGTFRCEFPGCNAIPFQTQYLLNSHTNVHSQSRPHYCPVASCPRAEGGKGFKRKNEMIRHGLVHQSPGYVCPFCPDREHKYPRPDNLQRHVRVHHMDKDKDDPQLRDVLAQRPEGGSRGRRRRVSGAE